MKRLNENAILESATYTRELSSVFVYPEQLEEMTIRLVDQENEIMNLFLEVLVRVLWMREKQEIN